MSRRKKRRTPRSVALFRKLPALRVVTVRVDGKKRIFDLHDEFRLTSADVESKFYTEAEQFLFWRSLLKIARNHLRETEAAYQEQRAWVDIALRQWAEENDEGFADWELKTRVDVDPTVIEARRKLIKSQDEADQLEMIVTGIEFHRSMVISAGAEKRRQTPYLND